MNGKGSKRRPGKPGAYEEGHDRIFGKPADSRLESIMVKVGGKSFRCSCACNVFHHPKDAPDLFECNACGERFEGS